MLNTALSASNKLWTAGTKVHAKNLQNPKLEYHKKTMETRIRMQKYEKLLTWSKQIPKPARLMFFPNL